MNSWKRITAATLMALASSLAFERAHAAESSEETLENGLRVIYISHKANPMVASSVVVGAGAIHEPAALNGSSHFLEHLLFNGTERRTQRQLYDEVDQLGAYNNATTREDHTLFTLLIQKEFAEQGLDIQADMLFHSTLPEEKFEKEKGIVLEELAKDVNDPGYVAAESFRAFAYAGTPLVRPVLGSEASIKALTRAAVLAYYKERYVPSNMVLTIMGDFDLPEMKAAVRRTFGKAARAAAPKPAGAAWPAVPQKNFSQRPLDTGRRYVHASMPIPLDPWDRQSDALGLLVAAIADGDDSPLQQDLTAGEKPQALSASLGISPRTAPWSTLDFEAAIPADGDPKRVLDTLADDLQSPDRLAAARARLASVRTAQRAERVLTQDQIHYFVLMRSAYVLGSPKGSFVNALDSIDAVDEADLDRAAGALRAGLASLRAAASGPGLAEAAVEYRPPAARPAAARRGDAVDEVLANGLAAHLERSDDSQVFAVHLAFRPRSASEPSGQAGIADFLHRLFLRGTIVHDRAALSRRIDDLGAKLKTQDDPSVPFDDYYTTPEFSFVRLEMPADQWREGLALLAEIVRYPRFDPAEVESVRKGMLDLQSRRAESTRSVAQDATLRQLAPGHPLSSPVLGTKDSIAAIRVEDLRAFHAKYVTGMRMLLTEVGPVPAADVLAAVRTLFGDLAAGDPPPAVGKVPVTPAGASVEQPLGKEQSSVGLAYVFDAPPADEAALLVAGAILADKLSFRLREEKGLAYSMSASCVPWGGRMKFEAVMATRKDNVDEALKGLEEGIAAFRTEALDPAAVERAANGVRGRLLMRRLTRINQAYFAALDRLAGNEVGEDLRRLARILEVRPADVKRVAAAYFDPARAARIVVR